MSAADLADTLIESWEDDRLDLARVLRNLADSIEGKDVRTNLHYLTLDYASTSADIVQDVGWALANLGLGHFTKKGAEINAALAKRAAEAS